LPHLPGSGPPRQLIIVLDRSAAMRATDVAPSRFAAAQAQARTLIVNAPTDEAVALVTLGAEPRTWRSRDAGDRASLLAALDALGPGGGQADLNGALPLLRAVLLPGRENQIAVYSAGVFAAPPDTAALAALPARIVWRQIGQPTDNLAITTLVTRRSALAPDRNELFARVANYATRAVTARSTIAVDGVTADTRQLQLAAGGTTDLVWQLPPGARGVRLRVEPASGGTDALPFDNEAQVVTRDVEQRRVLLVSDNPGDLGRALAAQPGVVLTTVPAGAYNSDQAYDLTVFDHFLPTALPRGGVLLVSPPPDALLLPRTGASETPAITRANRASPLLAGVDLSGLTFAPGPVYQLPDWANEVVGSAQGPLILAGNLKGRDVVALTFDLAGSSLPRRLAFPILIGNIVTELQTHRVPATTALGQGVLLEPVAGTQSVQLRDPGGATRDLPLTQTSGGPPSVYVEPDTPGLYALIERDSSGAVILQESFAVNGGDPVASNLRAVATNLPTGAGGIAPATSAPAPGTAPAPHRLGELWPALLALVLGLLLLEWIASLAQPGAPRRRPERVRPAASGGGRAL
ncbi:MAG: vWA domain-containing protein, partial [Thermomicrobiales bacterium]